MTYIEIASFSVQEQKFPVNSMDGVAKSQTWLGNFHFHFWILKLQEFEF